MVSGRIFRLVDASGVDGGIFLIYQTKKKRTKTDFCCLKSGCNSMKFYPPKTENRTEYQRHPDAVLSSRLSGVVGVFIGFNTGGKRFHSHFCNNELIIKRFYLGFFHTFTICD